MTRYSSNRSPCIPGENQHFTAQFPFRQFSKSIQAIQQGTIFPTFRGYRLTIPNTSTEMVVRLVRGRSSCGNGLIRKVNASKVLNTVIKCFSVCSTPLANTCWWWLSVQWRFRAKPHKYNNNIITGSGALQAEGWNPLPAIITDKIGYVVPTSVEVSLGGREAVTYQIRYRKRVSCVKCAWEWEVIFVPATLSEWIRKLGRCGWLW